MDGMGFPSVPTCKAFSEGTGSTSYELWMNIIHKTSFVFCLGINKLEKEYLNRTRTITEDAPNIFIMLGVDLCVHPAILRYDLENMVINDGRILITYWFSHIAYPSSKKFLSK